eukprot:9489731-Pyramimonas_sp.AAC.1
MFIVGAMSGQVADVRLLVAEMGRVTVLWEELWLSTLHELAADVARRVSALRGQERRLAESRKHLRGEKQVRSLRP